MARLSWSKCNIGTRKSDNSLASSSLLTVGLVVVRLPQPYLDPLVLDTDTQLLRGGADRGGLQVRVVAVAGHRLGRQAPDGVRVHSHQDLLRLDVSVDDAILPGKVVQTLEDLRRT